jgi:RNA polymerase sigma factor FliA
VAVRHENPERLIEDCQGLVRSLAINIHRKSALNVDLEDLIAYGQVGLAEAARDFDSSRGIQFSTYAYHRVRGSIYDGLSKMTWFGRTQYDRLRQERMNRNPPPGPGQVQTSDAENTADPDPVWFGHITQAVALVYLATDQPASESPAKTGPGSREQPSPGELAINKELMEKIRALMDSLHPKAAALIRARYFEGLTLQEAGERLGFTKSWASRLHERSLDQLAQSLRQLGLSVTA